MAVVELKQGKTAKVQDLLKSLESVLSTLSDEARFMFYMELTKTRAVDMKKLAARFKR